MISLRATSVAFGSTFLFLPLSKPLTYASLLAAIVLLTLTGAIRDELRDGRFPSWGWPAAVLASLPFLSLLIHRTEHTGVEYLSLGYYWLIPVFTYMAARRMSIRPWLLAFVVGTLVALLYAQLKLHGLLTLAHEPPAIGNYILYSQFLAMSVVICSLLYRDESFGVRRWLYLLAIAALLFGLATSWGRTGLLTVVVLSPFIVSNLLPRKSGLVVAAACIVGVAVLVSTPGVQMRVDAAVQDVAKLRESETRTSSGYRLDMWMTAGRLLQASPVVGAGPGAFEQAWRQNFPTEEPFREPHNAYVFHASGYGLIGLAALIVLYGTLGWIGWRRRDTLAGGLMFALAVALAVGSITNTMFLGTASRMMLMLFIGLQGNMYRLAHRPAPSGSTR
jgi:O-antigen ligase